MARSWWPWSKSEPVTAVYVICEKGVPVVACLTDQEVRQELATRDRQRTKVYQVPIVGAQA